jgi:hypothetical protein
MFRLSLCGSPYFIHIGMAFHLKMITKDFETAVGPGNQRQTLFSFQKNKNLVG